jgi:hypothetical protein
LEGPPFPDALGYLWGWFERLDRMRGVAMHGPERITAGMIRDAAALYGWDVAPHDVDGLMVLDIVTLYPGDED